jgi:hypothetical protein
MSKMKLSLAMLGALAAGLWLALRWGADTHAAEPIPQMAAATSSAQKPDAAAAAASAPVPQTAAQPALDLEREVARSNRWSLARAGHLPGVESSVLGDNLEQWILSLPAERQQAARAFAARYAPAYEIDHKAIQAWLLEMGFPSMEEVAAFDFDVHAKGCSPIECRNAKVAALAADHFLQQMESLAATLPAADAGNTGLAARLNAAQRETMGGYYSNVLSYAGLAKDSGNVLFAAYLRARVEELMGAEQNAAVIRNFIYACGDQRIAQGAMGDAGAGLMLSLAYGSPCHHAPGRPLFPVVEGTTDRGY